MPTIHYANGATVIIRRRAILNGEIIIPSTDGSSDRVTNSYTEEQRETVLAHAKEHGGRYRSSGNVHYAREQAGEVLALAARLWGRPVATEISGDTEPVPTTERSLADSLPDVDVPVSGFDNTHEIARVEQLADRAREAKATHEQDVDTLAYELTQLHHEPDRRLRLSANQAADIAKGVISRPTVLKILNGQAPELYRWYVKLLTVDDIQHTTTVEAHATTPREVIYERAVRTLQRDMAATGKPMPELRPLSDASLTVM